MVACHQLHFICSSSTIYLYETTANAADELRHASSFSLQNSEQMNRRVVAMVGAGRSNVTHGTQILLCLFLFATLCRSDPDLLVDYCVADTSASPAPLHLNGLPCIDPAAARAEHFATSALSRATNPTPFGFNVTVTSPGSSLPGANAQGLAMARTDLAPGGVAPPHSHPRASEVALVLSGSVLVGFADTSYRLYTQLLRAGEAFVFPRAMVHWMYNADAAAPAVVLSGLDSQSPGAQLLPLSAFRTEPRVPDEVLKKAFKINGQDVQRIQRNLGGSSS